MAQTAIGVDLGGTNIRGALISADGTIRQHQHTQTLADEGPDAVINRIASLIEEIIEREQVPSDVGIGVIAPGPLDPSTGVVLYGTNLPGWYDVPLRAILEDRLQRKVVIGNDANCAALGEWIFGAGQGYEHLIYVALGTGLGGGVISHGRLIEGIQGMGGELGHVCVDPGGPRCTCGSTGCVESYIGGWAIAREGRFLVRSERSPILTKIANGAPITAEMVAAAAEAGDREARAVFERATHYLAVHLGGMVNVFNPQMIVIGGGMAQAGDLIMKPLTETIPRYAMVPIYPAVQIRRSALGEHTGIYGAAARVFYAEKIEGQA